MLNLRGLFVIMSQLKILRSKRQGVLIILPGRFYHTAATIARHENHF